MSNQEFAELRWENGQLGMHELGGINCIIPSTTAKGSSAWERSGDTLESVVQQATICNKQTHHTDQHKVGGRWPGLVKKRTRSDSDYHGCLRKLRSADDQWADPSACGSANATFCRDSDTTMMTWPASYESSMTKTADEDSAWYAGSEGKEEGKTAKCDTERSHSSRKGRAAAVHNQSERRRRDRINQKMKALQKLVPNASKTDKASMLDEVIEYLKRLQTQVQMMNARNIMMPLGMQQLQMAMLARANMGVGLRMGMGMMNMSGVAYNSSVPHHLGPLVSPAPPDTANASAFVSAPVVVSSTAPQQAKLDQGNTTLTPLPDPFLGQVELQKVDISQDLSSASLESGVSLATTYILVSRDRSMPMNMEMYNRMAALYRQQLEQSAKTSSHTQLNPLQGGG